MNFQNLPLNLQQRRYYHIATAGFVTLALGYLLRSQLNAPAGWMTLLLGVFPNLLGSFATPFILLVLVSQHNTSPAYRGWRAFVLLNLFTFAVSLLIEAGHVVLRLGVWDANDVYASLIGGFFAMLVFAFLHPPSNLRSMS